METKEQQEVSNGVARISRQLGGYLLKSVPGLKVDVNDPDLCFSRSGSTHIYCDIIPFGACRSVRAERVCFVRRDRQSGGRMDDGEKEAWKLRLCISTPIPIPVNAPGTSNHAGKDHGAVLQAHQAPHCALY